MVALQNRHVVDFYDNDAGLVRRVAAYIREGLARGEMAIVIATSAHRRRLVTELTAQGVDVAAERATGMLRERDAGALLGELCRDGRIDHERFDAAIGELIHSGRSLPGIRLVGEMVDLLWAEGDVLGALSLEEEWAALAQHEVFTLYCCYGTHPSSGHEDELAQVRELHSAVVSAPAEVSWLRWRAAESFSPTGTSPRAARRFVAALLEQWGLVGEIDVATLIVSELSTNALLHAASPFEVIVSREASALRLAVQDESEHLPVAGQPTPSETSGRGIALISELAAAWGVDAGPKGKTVWADVSLAAR